MTDDEWDRVIGHEPDRRVLLLARGRAGDEAAGGGWIINIASLAARNYFATAGAYCASKAGLVAFSESVMLEVREAGIRVSVVMPGSVATDFSHPKEHADDSWKLTPADVAEVVMDLAASSRPQPAEQSRDTAGEDEVARAQDARSHEGSDHYWFSKQMLSGQPCRVV